MGKSIVFTIVAKNYIGLAKVLGASIKQYEAEVEFYVFIADEIEQDFKFPADGNFYIETKSSIDIDEVTWIKMSFQYNLTEFCTSIKPFCFSYLFNINSENSQVIYFDPDIFLFSSLQGIWSLLDKHDIILTPHILTLETKYSGDLLENNFLGSGLYNLGFIAFKNSAISIKVLQWWQQRLIDKCFSEKTEYLFTDQKWMEFLPCFLKGDQLHISTNLGMNVAPWNFYERKLIAKEDGLYIANRLTGDTTDQLVFVHFSGFNYSEVVVNNNKNIPHLKEYEDLNPLFNAYTSVISGSSIQSYFNLKYSYNNFSNGLPVTQFHRRLFRRLSQEEGLIDRPFNSDNEFFKRLKSSNLILSQGENFDKLNNRNLDGFEKKLYYVNLYHKLLFNVLGAKNYFLFSKFMSRYHRFENQIFLVSKKYMRNNFKHEGI
jgi:hypothetical protein